MSKVWMAALMMVLAGSAFAVNITIADEHSSGTGWYGSQEDQEVEPGCITGQQWDLEGFFLNGLTLSMVSGFDFVNGVPGHASVTSGDIFFDVNGDAEYGSGAHAGSTYNPSVTTSDTFGYDFVMDLDFATMTYSVYDISNAGSSLQLMVGEQINDASNPWRYVSGGTEVLTGGQIAYLDNLSDAAAQALGYNVTGGTHDVASVDLAWLTGSLVDGSFTSHFTIQCGNDNLMGHGVVPEPATMLLLGVGIVSITLRKRVFA